MIFLLPAPFLFFEFFVFVLVAWHFGFLTTIAIYWLPSILGLFLLPFMPGVGLLLLPPTLSTRLLALLFFLPSVRRFSQRFTAPPAGRRVKRDDNVIDVRAEVLSDSEPSAIRRDRSTDDGLK